MAKKTRKDLESLTQGLVNDLPLGGAQESAPAPEEAPVISKGAADGQESAEPVQESPASQEGSLHPVEAPASPKADGQEAPVAPFADEPAAHGEAAETGPGELTVSLPMGAEPEKLETIFLRVPAETKKALQGIAKRRKLSLNAFLAALLDDLAKKFGEAK